MTDAAIDSPPAGRAAPAGPVEARIAPALCRRAPASASTASLAIALSRWSCWRSCSVTDRRAGLPAPSAQTAHHARRHLRPGKVDPAGTRAGHRSSKPTITAWSRDGPARAVPRGDAARRPRALRDCLSNGAGAAVRDMVHGRPSRRSARPARSRCWPSDDIDHAGQGRVNRDVRRSRPAGQATSRSAGSTRSTAEGRIEQPFNWRFFTTGDSREPELAGICGAFRLVLPHAGDAACRFPIGVAAAIYLEEFAPKNRSTDLIEVNINNLAAVPSIVFGLLGLAVFLNIFGLPRSRRWSAAWCWR